MDSDVLDTDQVLPGRGVLRNPGPDVRLAPAAPVSVPERILRPADGALEDLEPLAITVIVTDVAWSLGHVDSDGARVKDVAIVPELERDLISRIDTSNTGAAGAGGGTAVAGKLVDGVEELLSRLNVVAVLANDSPVRALLAVDTENAIDVVGRDGLGAEGDRGSGGEGELHGGRSGT